LVFKLTQLEMLPLYPIMDVGPKKEEEYNY